MISISGLTRFLLPSLSSLFLASVAAAQAPTAQFTGSPRTGVASHTVFFTDLSTGSVTSWSWDFGDGGSSTLEDPTYVYTTPGTYTVSLTATGPGGSDTETKVGYITINDPPPVADFSGTPLTGNAPLAVAFTNLSTGAITTRLWDFGDGGTSSSTSPSHTYSTPGTYTVSLTVTGPGGSDTETKAGYVVVSFPPPVSDFTAAPTTGMPSLTVFFTSVVTGTVTSGSWTFGDGGTSTAQNPSHTYTAPGAYDVSLTVTGPGGSDTETKVGYIVVGDLAPVADFSGTPLSGLAPLAVSFSDLTANPVTSWSWTFGDGGTSTAQNPSHTYTTPGSYQVTLTATGPGGSDSEVKSDYVVVSYPPPVAQFFGSPLTGVAPLAVSFTNLSTGTITGYQWTFGDSPLSTSTATNPSHTYSSVGSYTVTLTAIGPGGTDTETKTAYVTVLEPAPVADFTGVPTTGVEPLTVAFTNRSTGNLTSRSWDFGDGGTSILNNPSHTYTASGTYTVSLTVTSAGGSDTETKVGYIVVADLPPVAAFSGTPLSGSPGLSVTFTDSSTGAITAWDWDFGDGNTSTAQNPSNTYAATGSYTVTLTAFGPGGLDSERKVGYVVVGLPPPVADFSADVTSGVLPLAVNFTDLTGGPVTSWSWTFGDGGTDTLQNPSHTYTTAGTYTVTLTSTGGGGSDSETKVGYIVVAEPPPIANFSGTPLSGILPLAVSFTDLSTGGGPVTSRSWTFGDGGTSTATNPSHTYTAAGTYTVSLTATGPGGTDTETKVGYVVVAEPPPVANFSGTPLSGVAPLTVVYTNLTTGGPVTSYSWAFGDGGASTSTNPTHVYTTAGTYTVALTATGPGGTDTETKVGYVVVGEPPPAAQFSASVTEGVAPLAVSFTDLSSGNITSWSWSFGDGGTSSSQNPSHTYTTGGTFTVSLTVVGPPGVDTETKTGYIDVKPVVAEFVGSPTSGKPPLLVSFTDLSQGTITSWSWSFGDGGTSTAQNVAHTYASFGQFTVTLTVTGTAGSDTETKVKYISVEKPGVDNASSPSDNEEAGEDSDFFGRPLIGSAPLTVDFHEMTRGTWVRFNWTFGDGGTSTQKNPTHTYTTPGLYTVALNVTRSGGAFSDTETKVGYIQVTALAGITDGSFEDSGASPLPSPAWSMSSAGTIVLGPDSSPEDAMPTHGEHWAVVSSEGTRAALPPSNPLGEGALPQGAAGIAQEFLFDVERPVLAFEAAFVLGDQPRSAANDFMSVDVSDGVTSFNLFYADSFSDFSRAVQAAPSDTRPMTELARVTRDLSELFPAADATTRLTLWVQAGNGADGENPSFAWVDDFRLGPVARAEVRSGGNPGCFASSMPVSGAPWRAEVDASAVPGARFTVVVGHEAALASDKLQAAGGLLVDLDSPQMFFSLLPASGGVDVHELLVPADPALLGRRLFTQAMVIGPASRTYCNAIDLTVGF